MTVGLAFATHIYDFLRAPIQAVFLAAPKTDMDRFYWRLTGPVRGLLPAEPIQGTLNVGSSPLEGITAFFQVGLIGGIVLALPVIAHQMWRFVAPALYQSERRLVFPLTAASTVLFLLGASFCYAIILPVSLPFFLTALDASAIISVQGYLQAIVRMLVGFGLCFQLPVVIWFLAKIGLVDHRDLIRFFRYAVVAIFVVAAIVTPDPTIFTQLLLAIPLIGLYGVGIGVAWFSTTKGRPVR
jgi:sec-independent protein translocase protein TatC